MLTTVVPQVTFWAWLVELLLFWLLFPEPLFDVELVLVFDAGVVLFCWVVTDSCSPAALLEPAALPLPVFTTTVVAATFWAWLVEALLFWFELVFVITGAALPELELDELELELEEELSAASALEKPADVIKSAAETILTTMNLFCIF